MTLEQMQTELNTLRDPADMQAELDALLDPADIPGDWTPHAREAYELKRSHLRSRLTHARRSIATLAEYEPVLAADLAWRDHLTKWRAPLVDEFTSMPPARTPRELGVLRNLELSIRAIDTGIRVAEETGWSLNTLRLGTLMRESGFVAAPPTEGRTIGFLPWFGLLPEVEHRIADLQQRIATARRRLEDCLLDDAARAARDAEAQARRARINALPPHERAAARAAISTASPATEEVATVAE